jgi:hypothetical protein
MQHAESCADLRRNTMQDPRNWLPDGVNIGNRWLAGLMEPPRQLPQQAGQAITPPNVPQADPVGALQQPGIIELIDIIDIFRNNRLGLNGNADARQNQPGN